VPENAALSKPPAPGVRPGENAPPKINLEWNDEDVLPATLSIDTEFVFRRMTEETIRAAQPGRRQRALDVGCGRGIDAATLAEMGAFLFGCDSSRLMVPKALEWIRRTGGSVRIVRGLAESLPFRDHSFSRVICKGAIDHFWNPDLSVSEMCRVCSVGGKVIISAANFESLSCSWGRKLNRLAQRFLGREMPSPHIWIIPPDHTYKFDYPALLNLARRHLRVEGIRGVSLFWGFPYWVKFLNILPRPLPLIFLQVFDKIACWYPDGSDVLTISGSPLKNLSCQERSRNMVDRSRFWGAILCIAIVVVALFFLWGISVQSYWALAIPVIIGFLGILGLGFWIGWTILTIKTTPLAPGASSASPVDVSHPTHVSQNKE
jgi:SAM-dependent methyltransferase